jgi:phosphoribosyl 1,2-cyclic phosphodiesterase
MSAAGGAGGGAWSAPRHKCVPGTKFIVDGFRHAHATASAYFLTHAHSDHYQGLSEQWRVRKGGAAHGRAAEAAAR